MRQIITIKDVAKHAGVSVATISRVLNNKGYVGAATRKKVEESIKELDYRPNEVARSLFKKQSKTIGLIVPDIMNPYFPELARAVEDIAVQLGYNVILCNSDENAEKELRYLEVLQQKYIDGIIVASNTLDAQTIFDLKIPVVSLDREISKDIPTIVVDNIKGAKKATLYLQKKGYQKIAHISGPHNIINANERTAGYREVVSNKPWFKESYISNGHYKMEAATDATLKLLALHPEIDGIFAANDTMAIGVMKAVHQLGLKIPEDIAVIGFDGIALSKAVTPELTTIEQPMYELGETAARMLIGLVEGKPLEKNYFKFDVNLLERDST